MKDFKMEYIKTPQELEQFAEHLHKSLGGSLPPKNLKFDLSITELESWQIFFPEGHPMRNNMRNGFTYHTQIGIDFYMRYVG